MFYHDSAILELCPRKFVKAWDEIMEIDGKYYMYKCSENNNSYKFSYADDNINIDELVVLGSFEEQLL